MNSERWQDIYQRQPLPTELPAKFDEAAFLREVELDDFVMGLGWNEATRNTVLVFAYLIVAALFSLVRAPWWGNEVYFVWVMLIAVLTWQYRRKCRRADQEFRHSLLERIERAETLIKLWRSFRRVLLSSPPFFGLYMAGLITQIAGPRNYAEHRWLLLTSSVAVGLFCMAVLLYWTIGENRKQDALFQARLNHLRRVKSRLLGEQANAPTTPSSS